MSEDRRQQEDDAVQPDRSQLQSRGSSRELRAAAPSMPKVDEGGVGGAVPAAEYGDDMEK